MVGNVRGVSLTSQLEVGESSPRGDQRKRANFSCKDASDSSNFSVRKKCRNCTRGKIVPGANDTFEPVVPQTQRNFYMGNFLHSPHGVGAYAINIATYSHNEHYNYRRNKKIISSFHN